MDKRCATWALQTASMLCTLRQVPSSGNVPVTVASEGYISGTALRKRAGSTGITPDVFGSSKWTLDFWVHTPLERNGQELYTVVGSRDALESHISFKRTCTS